MHRMMQRADPTFRIMYNVQHNTCGVGVSVGAVVLWCAVYDDGCMVCPRAHCCFRVYAHVMPSPSDVSDTHQH